MLNTTRTFIAVDLDQNIKQAIVEIQDSLKQIDCPIKWVAVENMHLTLKFLGDIPIKNIDQIKLSLEGLFKDTQTITTEITNLGAFPDTRHPRILWTGLKDTVGEIARLALLLENGLENMGFKKEQRPFHPHITIGRVRFPKNIHLLSEAISNCLLPNNLIQIINSVILVKSTLTTRGPIYEILKTIRLKENISCN